MVLVIGATNRRDNLDPALRRAGRFDREIAVPILDEKAREQILRVMSRGMRHVPQLEIDRFGSCGICSCRFGGVDQRSGGHCGPSHL